MSEVTQEKKTVKMSLQRALDKLNLTEKKITQAICELIKPDQLVAVVIGNKTVNGYKDNEEFETLAKARFQSVIDFIQYRDRLKQAIIQANANTEITVAGEKISIAAAIDRRSAIQYRRELLETLRRSYQHAITRFEREDEKFREKLDKHLEILYGKEGKAKAEENKEALKPFMDLNKPHFVDPLNLKAEIDKLQQYIDDFDSEIKFALSEANVRTEIEIEE